MSVLSRVVLVVVAVLALLGGLRSPAPAQTPCTKDGDASACDDSAREVIERAPESRWQPEPRRGWSLRFGDSTRDGGMNDGARFSAPDGRMCWEHGDHFHCR